MYKYARVRRQTVYTRITRNMFIKTFILFFSDDMKI